MSSIKYPPKFIQGLKKLRPKLTQLGIHLNEEEKLAWCGNILCNPVTFQWNVYRATFEKLLFKIAMKGYIEISLGTGYLNQINNLCFLMTMEFTDDMPQQANICSIFYKTAWDADSRKFIKIYDKHGNILLGESRKAEAAINFLKTIAKLFGCKDVCLQDHSQILSKNQYFIYPMAKLKYLQPSEFSSYYYRYGFDRKDIPAEKKTIKLESPKEISEQKLEDNNYEDFLKMMDLRISDAPTLCKVNEHILKTSKKDSKDLPEAFESNQYNQKLVQFRDMVFSKFRYLKLDDNNNAIAVNFDLNDYLYCDLSKLVFSTSNNVLHFLNETTATEEDFEAFGSSSPSKKKRKNTSDEFSSDDESDESDESEEHDENPEEKEKNSPSKRQKFTSASSSQVSSPSQYPSPSQYTSSSQYPSSSQNSYSTSLSRQNTHDIISSNQSIRPPLIPFNSNHDVMLRHTSIPISQIDLVDNEWEDPGVRIEFDSESDDEE